MEPRARAGRHKGGLNFGEELKTLLYGAGAPSHPDISNLYPDSLQYLNKLPTENKTNPPSSFHRNAGHDEKGRPKLWPQPYPETVRVLDEMVTDFIIEVCHQAVTIASYSGRAKLKLGDFEWAVRKDAAKLGRAQELLRKKRNIEKLRRVIDAKDEKMQVGDMQELGEVVGEEGTGKGKGRGRGRRKKRNIEEVDGAVAKDAAPADEGENGPVAKRAKSDVG